MAKAKVKTTATPATDADTAVDKDSKKMRYGSAWYVAEPTVEIYIFINEEPSGLPENAAKIVETTKVDELLNAVEPYFVLGSGS